MPQLLAPGMPELTHQQGAGIVHAPGNIAKTRIVAVIEAGDHGAVGNGFAVDRDNL